MREQTDTPVSCADTEPEHELESDTGERAGDGRDPDDAAAGYSSRYEEFQLLALFDKHMNYCALFKCSSEQLSPQVKSSVCVPVNKLLTVMYRVTTFRSTTAHIHDGGLIILQYNIIT